MLGNCCQYWEMLFYQRGVSLTLLARAVIVTCMNTEMSRFPAGAQPLVNRTQMGRLLRAARVIAGFDRVEDAAAAIHEKTGVAMSARTLYALERGEQALTLEHMLAFVMTFEPPGSVVFFNGGYRDDVQAMLRTYGKEAYGGRA